jgi:hypothetical protein
VALAAITAISEIRKNATGIRALSQLGRESPPRQKLPRTEPRDLLTVLR